MQQTGVVLVKQLPFCVVYECLYQIFLPVVHTIRIELISCCILRITEEATIQNDFAVSIVLFMLLYIFVCFIMC